jgi:hypothetical protein
MMNKKIEAVESIDEKILDAIDLLRMMWPNFNSIPRVDAMVAALNAAYRASGRLCDDIDKGWIK